MSESFSQRIERLKKNERGWLFLPDADRDCIRQANQRGKIENLTFEGEWEGNATGFSLADVGAHEVFRIRPDYQPEPEPSEFKDQCNTCEHEGDSGNEYCGSCDGPARSNWKEAGWHREKRLQAQIDGLTAENKQWAESSSKNAEWMLQLEQKIDRLTRENVKLKKACISSADYFVMLEKATKVEHPQLKELREAQSDDL